MEYTRCDIPKLEMKLGNKEKKENLENIHEKEIKKKIEMIYKKKGKRVQIDAQIEAKEDESIVVKKKRLDYELIDLKHQEIVGSNQVISTTKTSQGDIIMNNNLGITLS